MLRKAQIKDVNKICVLFNSAKELGSAQSHSKKFIKDYITTSVNFMFVYEEKNKIIGMINGQIWKNKGYAYIENLVVNKKFRKRGIATELYTHLEKYCKKLRLTGIYTLTEVSNKKVHKFNKKMGFKKGKSFYYFEKEI